MDYVVIKLVTVYIYGQRAHCQEKKAGYKTTSSSTQVEEQVCSFWASAYLPGSVSPGPQPEEGC